MTKVSKELESTLANLAINDRKASLRSLVYAILAFLIGTLWITYSFYEVYRLKNESEELQNQIMLKSQQLDSLKVEIIEKKTDLDEAIRILGIASKDVTLLKNFGFLSDSVRATDLKNLLQQSRLANEELQKIKSITLQNERRAGITIRYYRKGIDHARVEKVLNDLKEKRGFNIEVGQAREPDTPTNSIWIVSESVYLEDIKLVAYNLIRFGIHIKYIGLYPKPQHLAGIKGTQIWVGGDYEVVNNPIWTVEKIRDATKF